MVTKVDEEDTTVKQDPSKIKTSSKIQTLLANVAREVGASPADVFPGICLFIVVCASQDR